LLSYPAIIYSRILSSFALPEAVTQSIGWLLKTMMSAAEHICQTALQTSGKTLKHFFKPFPYTQEPRETVGKAVQLGRAREHPTVYHSIGAIPPLTTVLQQVMKWHCKLESAFCPPLISGELAPWGTGKFIFRTTAASKIHEGNSEPFTTTVNL